MRFFLSLLLVLGFFTLALPQDDPVDAAVKADTVKPAKIAQDYAISVDSVNGLKTAYKLGYGEVSKALALARKSGLSVEEIIKMKTEQKMGWGKITKELELKPGKDYKAGEAAPEKKAEVKCEKKMEKQAQKEQKQEQKMEKKMQKQEEKAAQQETKGKI